MSVAHEPEAKNVIHNNDVIAKDKSTHICTNCGYRHQHIKQNMKWSIGLIIAGIIGIPFSISVNMIWIIGSLLPIAVGLYGVSTN